MHNAQALIGHKKPFAVRLRSQLGIQMMVWPALIFAIIFCYVPMGGIIIAFKDYKLTRGILASPFVGLRNFQNLFDDYYMGQIIRNTLVISILNIVVSYPTILLFTLLLNEIHNIAYKRVIQTISYLPHFISWSIMATILNALLSANDGILNQLMLSIGLISKPINYLTEPGLYWPMVTISSIWKELGWSAIVYLAVINGIDETLYEAAKIDGAGRFQRMWYITLPMLKGIIAIQLIMSVAGLLDSGFQQAYMLMNSVNASHAKTLSYYVYEAGLNGARFSFATAIGLVQSLVSCFLMIMANTASKKLSGRGLY